MSHIEALDEVANATAEEWEVDPFSVAASIIRTAAYYGLANSGAMSEKEAQILMRVIEYTS